MDNSVIHENGHATSTSNNSSGMDFLGIGNAIAGIAGAYGTIKASKENRKAQQETNAANLLLARQQNDWNIQQWEREMAYNSPANKLKLLEEAGLNPVWYGANLGPTETQAPKSADLANQVAPQLDAGAIGTSLANLSSSLVSSGQYYLTKKQQALEERKIGIEEQRLGIQSAETKQNIAESVKRVEKMDSEIEKIASEKNWNNQQIEESKAKVRQIDKQIDEIQQRIEESKEKISLMKTEEQRNKAQSRLMNVQAWQIRKMCPLEMANLRAMTNLTEAQYSTEIEKMYNFMMDTNLKEETIRLTKTHSVKLQREADGQLYINEMLSQDVDYNEDLHDMVLFTGYLTAINGTLNASANVVSAGNGWFGPQGKMYNSIGDYNRWQMGSSTRNPIGFTNYGDYHYNVTR